MKYNPALDGLRAIAVTAVVLFHARAPGAWGGFLGVDVFFVLSGFLITSLLLAELEARGAVALRAFYWRRIVRLTPALLLMLAVYLMLAPMAWPWDNHLTQIAIAAAYLSDYTIALSGEAPGPLSHTWSLSVEMHFYLLWPVLVIAAWRRGGVRFLVITLAAAYAVATLWRWACVADGQAWSLVYSRFDTRLSGLILGAWLAAVRHDEPVSAALNRYLPRFVWWLPLLALAGLSFGWGRSEVAVWGFTVIELASLAALVEIDRGQRFHRVLAGRWLVWLGKLSYGVYLWHYPMFRLLRDELPWHQVLLIGFPLSVVLAALSFYTVETWAKRLRVSRRLLGPDTVKAARG